MQNPSCDGGHPDGVDALVGVEGAVLRRRLAPLHPNLRENSPGLSMVMTAVTDLKANPKTKIQINLPGRSALFREKPHKKVHFFQEDGFMFSCC